MDFSSSPIIVRRDNSMILLESLSSGRSNIADICESHAFKNACQFVSTLKTHCSKTRTKYLESRIFEIICEQYIQHFIQSFQSQVKSLVFSSHAHIKDQHDLDFNSTKSSSSFSSTLSKTNYKAASSALKNGISNDCLPLESLCGSEDIAMKSNDMVIDKTEQTVIKVGCNSYNNKNVPHNPDSFSFKDTTTKEYRQSLKQSRKNSISNSYAKRCSNKQNKNEEHKHSRNNVSYSTSNKFISVLNNLCKGTLNKHNKVTHIYLTYLFLYKYIAIIQPCF